MFEIPLDSRLCGNDGAKFRNTASIKTPPTHNIVIPVETGIQLIDSNADEFAKYYLCLKYRWIPAYAGMTLRTVK